MASCKTDFLWPCIMHGLQVWIMIYAICDRKISRRSTITRPNPVGKTPVSGGTSLVQPLLGQKLGSLINWGESVGFMSSANSWTFQNSRIRTRETGTVSQPLVRVKLYGTLKNTYTDFSEWWMTHCIAFPLLDTVDLFGLTLDNSLNFGNRLGNTLRKLARKLEGN